mgnify:CR=1 FL=1
MEKPWERGCLSSLAQIRFAAAENTRKPSYPFGLTTYHHIVFFLTYYKRYFLDIKGPALLYCSHHFTFDKTARFLICTGGVSVGLV